MPKNGTRSKLRPGSMAGVRRWAPIVRASTSAAHLRDLVVAQRNVQHHLVLRRVPQRIVGDVVGVAVGIGTVPERLDHRQDQRPLEQALGYAGARISE